MAFLKKFKLLAKRGFYQALGLSLSHLTAGSEEKITTTTLQPELTPKKVRRRKGGATSPQAPNKAQLGIGNDNRVVLWGRVVLGYLTWLLNEVSTYIIELFKQMYGDGALYLRGLFIVFFVDALIIDDEPLWEPIE